MVQIVVYQHGNLQIEKALENMKWNMAKFESELTIFANTQSPRIQHHLWKQYVIWMQQCGVPIELVKVT